MKRFQYFGPVTGLTLADGTEQVLLPSGFYSLPEESERVALLVGLGHLQEAPEVKPAKAGKEVTDGR